MKKLINLIRNCFIVFLAAIMAFGTPLAVYAENQNTYISAVSIGSKAALESKGYTVVQSDLRNGMSSDPMYLGYKTTMKKSEAITDIRALNQYGGYTKLDFQAVISSRMSEISETSANILEAIKEFRVNYQKGKKPAKIAYDTLNAFYIPETGQSLGDYFLDTKVGTEEISNIVLMSTNVVLSYITNMLVLAVSDDISLGDMTWIQRAVEIGPFNFDGFTSGKIAEFYQSYDREYRQSAYNILSSLKLFVDTYTAGLKVYPDGVVTDLEDLGTETENNDTYVVDVMSGEEEDDPRPRYAMAFSVMKELNSLDDEGYKYFYGTKADGSEQSFGEYLISIVNTAKKDETAACRMIYPLIVSINGQQALSDGQTVAMSLSDFSTFFLMTGSDDPDYDDAAESYKENVAEMLSYNNNERISVFFGVNTDVYTTDQDIYLTSKAARETAGSDRYSLITAADPHNDELSKADKLWNKMITAGCWAIGALGGAIIGIYLTAKCTAALAAGTAWVATANAALTVGCVIGVVGIVMLIVACIVLFVFFLLWDEAEDDESEAEKQRKAYKWANIPTYLVDYKKYKSITEDYGKAIAYESVNVVDTNKPANLNTNKTLSSYVVDALGSGESVPWNVLYTTKDPNAGSPICLNNSNSLPFIVQYNDAGIPSGYSSVCFFEEKTAANVNLGEGTSYPIYIMMHRLDNGAEENSLKGKYISSVMLCTGSSSDGVIGEIMRNKEEYEIVYQNLTPNSGVYTYIGYTTTNVANYAIKDLRVAYSAASDKVGTTIKYGSSEYVICGDVGELILLQSYSQEAGTPILASQELEYNGVRKTYNGILATTTLGAVPEGYEPVNLFCGGPAFDFNGGGNWEALITNDKGELRIGVGNAYVDSWKNHVYLYYNPETKYTSGEKYLGGLAFFSLPTGNSEYISDMGWTIFDNQNLGGAQAGTSTRLCYSETYNPYKAIYDIKSYKAELSATAVPFNVNYGSSAYAACDVFAQGGGGLYSFCRTIRATHSYRSCYFYEGGGMASFADQVDYNIQKEVYAPSETDYRSHGSYEVVNIDGKNYYSKINCIGLYTTGRCYQAGNTTPIKVSDLMFTYAKPTITNGGNLYDYNTYTPVRDFRDAYSDYAANLGANTYNGTSDFYLFIKKPDATHEVPEYIASVTVAYATGNSDGTNTPFDSAIMSLIPKGTGRLYEYNLAGDYQEFTTGTMQDWCCVDEDGKPSTAGRYGDDRWPYTFHYNVITTDCVKNAKVAYVWITYTNVPTNALSDIVICESTQPEMFKDTLGYYYTDTQKKATRANICGKYWQNESDSSTYYCLYSITHNGHVITDFDISDVPMENGKWTSLGFDNKCVLMDDMFIHTTHKDENEGSQKYISGIFTGSGSDWKWAQIDLLNKGCRCFVGYDTNPSGEVEYLGYSVTLNYENAYSSFKLIESGQNDTITKSQYGWDIEYNYISSDLNNLTSSIIIKLFGSKSETLATMNGGSGDEGHYIDEFMFSESAEKNISTVRNGQTYNWSLVTDMDGNSQPLSMGFVESSNGEKKYTESAYLYVHYSDNEFDNNNFLASVFKNSNILTILGFMVIILAGIFIAVKKAKRIYKV